MAHIASKHALLAAAVILCITLPSGKAQDAVQIVARAALCFDNHTVINNCLQQMGIATNSTGVGAASGGGLLADTIPTSPNASAVLCDTPCFGHMMLMTDCVDGILSNFQGYSPGFMQGVRAIFQMSCGTGGAAANPPAAAHAHGAAKGNAASGGKTARDVSGGAATHATNGAPAGLRVSDLLPWTTVLVAAHHAMSLIIN